MKNKQRGQQLEAALKFLEAVYHIAPADVLQLIKNKEKQEKEEQSCYIPISLFAATPLSSLEAIAVYMRDIQMLQFSLMGRLLGRNPIALNTTYRVAKKKWAQKLQIRESKYYIPCKIFAEKKGSVLETIAFYLKTEYMLRNHEIAVLLHKDPRTIWTVLKRIERKVKK